MLIKRKTGAADTACATAALNACEFVIFYIPLAKSAKTCWQANELMVWASPKNRIRCRKAIFESVPNTVSTKAVQAFLLSIYHFFSLPSDVVCLDLSARVHSSFGIEG